MIIYEYLINNEKKTVWLFPNYEWAIEWLSGNRFLFIIIYNILPYSKFTDDESTKYFKEKENVKTEFIYFILN